MKSANVLPSSTHDTVMYFGLEVVVTGRLGNSVVIFICGFSFLQRRAIGQKIEPIIARVRRPWGHGYWSVLLVFLFDIFALGENKRELFMKRRR